MKPEAKAKVRSRHLTAIGMYVSWIQEFPKKKQPSLERRVEYFDRCVDSVVPKETAQTKKKRAKIEQPTTTRSNT